MGAGAVVIVGAGPCGIGCARELVALGHENFTIVEARSTPGGLASSVVDPQGFTWDMGGHVVFSHYGEFDHLLDDVMHGDVERHERSSFVRIGDRWVPYPLQNNLHRLPDAVASEALVGLIDAQRSLATMTASDDLPVDFATWMESMFGEGICRHFMRPYNEKVWAHPAAEMSSGWIAERVSVVDWRHAVDSLVRRRDDLSWGPNNLFAFPSQGGTGEIYRRAAEPLAHHIVYDAPITGVDLEIRTVTTATGAVMSFDHLVWTGALDRLIELIADAPDAVRTAAAKLVHNSVTMVGVGYATPISDPGSWFYFPDPNVPFYRATNFAKYAAANVPGARTDLYSSWMTEIASSSWRPLEAEGLGDRVDAALRACGLVDDDAERVSTHVEHIPYGYPVPSVGRDAALRVIQPWLMAHDVLARGRFGAWKYELGNMDHAVKMGVDVARSLVSDSSEEAWSL